jgi:hypothetical protein
LICFFIASFAVNPFDINPFVKAVVVVALQILFRLNEQLNLHDALTEARDKSSDDCNTK